MGLFSFLSKNKQASSAQDSGYYSGVDEQASARARRTPAGAASAPDGAEPRRAGKGAAVDPVLPEKKRARRRLVGAIALALAVAVGLPMLLDSEPKPLALDIAIHSPSKDQVVPAPISGVTANAALGPAEQIVAMPPAPAIVMPPEKIVPVPAPAPLPDTRTMPASDVKAMPAAAAPVETRAGEPKPELKPESRPIVKTAPKVEEKPAVEPVKADVIKPKPTDAERALAILEGRAVVKAPVAAAGNFVVQVAALATQDKVDELQERLKGAGIDSYTQKITTSAGQRIRVRVGPFGSREEAEKALASVAKLGLNGSVVPV